MSVKDTQAQKDNVLNMVNPLKNKDIKPVFYKRLERIEERSQRLAAAFLVLGDTIKDTAPVSVYQGLFDGADRLVHEAVLASSDVSISDLRKGVMGVEKALRFSRGALRTGYWSGYISEMNFTVVDKAANRLFEEIDVLFGVLDKQRPGAHLRLFSADILPSLETDGGEPSPTAQPAHGATGRTKATPKVEAQAISHELVPSAPEKQSTGSVTAEQRQVKQNRQVRIIGLLSRLGTVSMTDITGEFPGVSSKTIQRDLNNLIKAEKVVREGERRWSTYRLA